MRITPENLTVIESNQRVLIGTNESGIHGAGIAKYAHDNWALEWGVGFGPSGLCFGLPTKNWKVRQLPLVIIGSYVERYIDWCQTNRYENYVTKIGCGLAGWTVPDIAPMFERCKRYQNMWLPQDFLDFYEGTYKVPIPQTQTVDDDNDSRHG